jgi:hypothetical protein
MQNAEYKMQDAERKGVENGGIRQKLVFPANSLSINKPALGLFLERKY